MEPNDLNKKLVELATEARIRRVLKEYPELLEKLGTPEEKIKYGDIHESH
jgi:hypothetical protein